MKRTLVIVAAMLLTAIGPTRAQQQQQPQRTQQRQRYVSPRAQRQAQTTKQPLYQRRDTWYEFLLKQFNPDNLDYGTWIERRRQAFLDTSVRNPYFKYSAAVTIALFFMAIIYAKHWIDHRRAMWITAEMMADLYNHDTYSRQVARDAIQKYNDHIERCNRAVEASKHGTSFPATDSDANCLRSELQSVTDERNSYKREKDKAAEDLAEKQRLLADMSLRLDALAKKSNATLNAPSVVDMRTADQKLVQHINNLQEQLYAERRKNERFKGA